MNSESPSTTSEISYKISTLRFQTLGTYIFSILYEDFSFLSHTLHYPAAPRGGDGYAAISKQVIVYFANYPTQSSASYIPWVKTTETEKHRTRIRRLVTRIQVQETINRCIHGQLQLQELLCRCHSSLASPASPNSGRSSSTGNL